MTDPKRLDDAVAAFHAALDTDPDSDVFHCPPPCTCGTTEGRTREIVGALLAAGWAPPPKPGRVELLDDGPIRFRESSPTTFYPGFGVTP